MISLRIVTVLAFTAFAAAAAQQQPSYKREVPDSLAKQAKITEAQALAAAQKRVPKGTAKALELEKEKGKLVYSFEFAVPGKTGIDEVNVDAMTGKVLSVEHESPEDEKNEAKKPPKKP